MGELEVNLSRSGCPRGLTLSGALTVDLDVSTLRQRPSMQTRVQTPACSIRGPFELDRAAGELYREGNGSGCRNSRDRSWRPCSNGRRDRDPRGSARAAVEIRHVRGLRARAEHGDQESPPGAGDSAETPQFIETLARARLSVRRPLGRGSPTGARRDRRRPRALSPRSRAPGIASDLGLCAGCRCFSCSRGTRRRMARTLGRGRTRARSSR